MMVPAATANARDSRSRTARTLPPGTEKSMCSMPDVSIRLRFYIVLVCVSSSLLVLGVWGWASSAQANRSAAQIFTRSNAVAADIASLRESLS